MILPFFDDTVACHSCGLNSWSFSSLPCFGKMLAGAVTQSWGATRAETGWDALGSLDWFIPAGSHHTPSLKECQESLCPEDGQSWYTAFLCILPRSHFPLCPTPAYADFGSAWMLQRPKECSYYMAGLYSHSLVIP